MIVNFKSNSLVSKPANQCAVFYLFKFKFEMSYLMAFRVRVQIKRFDRLWMNQIDRLYTVIKLSSSFSSKMWCKWKICRALVQCARTLRTLITVYTNGLHIKQTLIVRLAARRIHSKFYCSFYQLSLSLSHALPPMHFVCNCLHVFLLVFTLCCSIRCVFSPPDEYIENRTNKWTNIHSRIQYTL